ncbi:hypothetical protein DPMN_046710 [Dreissena polymorpha]|uniref:Uncharacterized protein n=1 Tax=Dreissena polymorpha TaxID=45954 RepID=A0A9D4D894_DREPO|nr:hypothetical protein DPMN_046710 [Dreissena polymorpha]
MVVLALAGGRFNAASVLEHAPGRALTSGHTVCGTRDGLMETLARGRAGGGAVRVHEARRAFFGWKKRGLEHCTLNLCA